MSRQISWTMVSLWTALVLISRILYISSSTARVAAARSCLALVPELLWNYDIIIELILEKFMWSWKWGVCNRYQPVGEQQLEYQHQRCESHSEFFALVAPHQIVMPLWVCIMNEWIANWDWDEEREIEGNGTVWEHLVDILQCAWLVHRDAQISKYRVFSVFNHTFHSHSTI